MANRTRKTWPEKETQVAEPIVAWLEEMGWAVYQEVASSDGRADIVAVRERVRWVIEVKRSLSLALLAQAHAWKRRAHRVSIAYPRGRMDDTRRLAHEYAAADGIGIIEVERQQWTPTQPTVVVIEVAKPALRRTVLPVTLVEAQRTYAKAGNADGKFWSPFRETCERVRKTVDAHPGLTIREVVDAIDHHYASKQSARGALLGWAEAGKIDGVIVRGGAKDEGARRLYPSAWVGPIESRCLLAARISERRVDLLRDLCR